MHALNKVGKYDFKLILILNNLFFCIPEIFKANIQNLFLVQKHLLNIFFVVKKLA
jgi:hypothetical protein